MAEVDHQPEEEVKLDFYASQGKQYCNNQIELTIQGQTITSVFGNKDQAKFNFEQLLTAGLKMMSSKALKKI
jgi:phosphoenolpyruvate carboxylase